ncbi:MAG: hypothetical protein JRG68_01545, partial [Deltaproteobacteria bacterium]|nr:hypothetical protein [Deltaproteobacteria bacterium]
MSPEMSAENPPGSLYINQQVLKAPAVPTGFENLCNQIDRYPVRFSPVAFIGKYLKLFPVDAVKEALEALLKKLSSGIDQCFNAWGYAIAVIKRIGPNYNEAEYIKEARQFNEKPPTFEELEAQFDDEEDMETYEPDKDLPDDVPTIAELRAIICGEDKTAEPEEPVEEEKLDIDQICNRINQHETKFDPLIFIEHHVKKYTTDTITQVLEKVLNKMDMAAGVDKILLISFDFWQYGSALINQMKSKDHDKPEEKRIRKELSQQNT